MDPIRAAILDGDSNRVWELTANANLQADELAALLDLALRKGVLASVMPIIALGGTLERWSPSGDLIVEYLGEISSGWLAGWLIDIEYEAYSLTIGEDTSDGWSYLISDRQVDDLRMLSSAFSGWAAWSGGAAWFVPMSWWRPMYERWQRRQQ